MFRMLFVFLAVVWTVSTAPVKDNHGEEDDEIYYHHKEQDEKGNYEFRFLTSNGLWREEKGTVVNVGEPNEHIVVKGIYSYTDSEGEEVKIQYLADENGFHIVPLIPLTTPPTSLFYPTYQPSVIASLLGGG